MNTWQQLDTAGRPCWSLELRHGLRVRIFAPAPDRALQQYVITVELVQASGASTFLGRVTSAADEGLRGAQWAAGELVQQLCTEIVNAMGEAE